MPVNVCDVCICMQFMSIHYLITEKEKKQKQKRFNQCVEKTKRVSNDLSSSV